MSTAANKSLVRAFVEAWNAKDLDRFDDLMSQSCQLTVGGATMSCSPSATRAIAEHWFGGFPDYRFELLDLIAEGDKVVARMPFTGTHTGQVLDLPPTGRPVQVSEIVIFRIAEGKIIEAWEEYDEQGMRRQLASPPRCRPVRSHAPRRQDARAWPARVRPPTRMHRRPRGVALGSGVWRWALGCGAGLWGARRTP